MGPGAPGSRLQYRNLKTSTSLFIPPSTQILITCTKPKASECPACQGGIPLQNLETFPGQVFPARLQLPSPAAASLSQVLSLRCNRTRGHNARSPLGRPNLFGKCSVCLTFSSLSISNEVAGWRAQSVTPLARATHLTFCWTKKPNILKGHR